MIFFWKGRGSWTTQPRSPTLLTPNVSPLTSQPSPSCTQLGTCVNSMNTNDIDEELYYTCSIFTPSGLCDELKLASTVVGALLGPLPVPTSSPTSLGSCIVACVGRVRFNIQGQMVKCQMMRSSLTEPNRAQPRLTN